MLQVQEQFGCSEVPLEYKGRLALDPILLDRTCLFRALEAGVFELNNTQKHQNVMLHHLTLGTNISFLTQGIVNTL